jgi:NADPH:quinone reductase
MQAVVLGRFGPPDELSTVDLADPVAGPGQVVVEVAFANITFVETQIRAGKPPYPGMLPELPVVMGNGVGGVVAYVGEGVEPALVGTRVVTSTGGSGGYAERVAVPAAGLIEVPTALALDDAVALLADGRTAMALALAAKLEAGETVLVEAAAGGVGSLLVQLAKSAGNRVVATAGSSLKLDVASRLGADAAVNYREVDWADRLRGEFGGVDVVFDGVGGQIGRDAFGLLNPAGRFCAFGMASGSFAGIEDAERPDVTRVNVLSLAPQQTLDLARDALFQAAEGRIHPVIGQRFALARAADAHAAIEARSTIGKTLLVAGADAGGHR